MFLKLLFIYFWLTPFKSSNQFVSNLPTSSRVKRRTNHAKNMIELKVIYKICLFFYCVQAMKEIFTHNTTMVIGPRESAGKLKSSFNESYWIYIDLCAYIVSYSFCNGNKNFLQNLASKLIFHKTRFFKRNLQVCRVVREVR